MNADQLLSSRQVGLVDSAVPRPPPSSWVIATDGSATMAIEHSPATAGWGFVVHRVGVLEGLECECWGEVLLDERDPRSLGADSLSLIMLVNCGRWPKRFCGFAMNRMIQVMFRSPLSMTRKWPKVW